MFTPEGPRPPARLAGPHRGRPRDPARRADAAGVLHGRRRRRASTRSTGSRTSAYSHRCYGRRRSATSTRSRARRGGRGAAGRRSPPEWYEPPGLLLLEPGRGLRARGRDPIPGRFEELDYELELAAVIGAVGEIAGFTVMNDWSARDLQRAEMSVGLGPAKGKDFATSLGPVRRHARRARRPSGEMVARVNGEERSRGELGDMHHSWDGDRRPRRAEHATAAGRRPRLGHGRLRLHPRARRRTLAAARRRRRARDRGHRRACATPSARVGPAVFDGHRIEYP